MEIHLGQLQIAVHLVALSVEIPEVPVVPQLNPHQVLLLVYLPGLVVAPLLHPVLLLVQVQIGHQHHQVAFKMVNKIYIYVAFVFTLVVTIAFFLIGLSIEIDIKYKLEDPINHCKSAYQFAKSFRFYSMLQLVMFLSLAVIILFFGLRIIHTKKSN